MSDDEITRVRALRQAGRHEEHRAAACALVAASPAAVEAQLEAAYGLDRAGEEQRAIVHYEAARRLGVPASERRPFTVGLGSTLRNVGRHADAIAVFAEAVTDDPDYPPFAAFLALALARGPARLYARGRATRRIRRLRARADRVSARAGVERRAPSVTASQAPVIALASFETPGAAD